MSEPVPAIRAAGAAWMSFVDFVYPRNCVLCRGVAVDAGKFCEGCLIDVWPQSPNSCYRCGAPLGPHIEEEPTRQRGCYHCRRDRFRFRTVHRLGTYAEGLSGAVMMGQTRGRESLIAGLTDLLWSFATRLREDRIDLIVPVPMHWRRRFEKPFNPPDVMAFLLSQKTRIPFRKVLRKIKHTDPQSVLSPSKRRENLRGAFRVPRRFRQKVKGRRVLLVDDVLTTGSTANECSRELLAAGAQEVTIAVIARGIGES